MPLYKTGLEKEHPVTVPGNLIRTKYYDGDGEIFAMTGVPLVLGKQAIKSPSLGVWSLLETFDCPFVNSFHESSPMDSFRALYINEFRQEAALEVHKWINEDGPVMYDAEDKDTWLPWDHKVVEYGNSLKFDINNVGCYEDIRLWFELSFGGYEMIPKSGGGGSSSYWFGAEMIASTISAVGQSLNLTPMEILWDTPMCLVGHTIAQSAAQKSPKAGVARPKCPEHMRQLFDECVERAKNGQLHPWQKEEPTSYPLDPLQAYLHPSLVGHFSKIRKAAADKEYEKRKKQKDSMQHA